MKLMFKLRRDKTRVGDESTANAQGFRETSLGTGLFTPRKWHTISPVKKILIVLLALVAVSSVGYVVGEWVKYEEESKIPSKTLPTEKEFLTSHLAELLAEPPNESEPAEVKAAYYDDLTLTFADQGQYEKAVGSFTTREAITVDGLLFYDYMNLAQYQYQSGNKAGALAALDKAETAVNTDPKQPEDSRAELFKHIATLRAGYAQ